MKGLSLRYTFLLAVAFFACHPSAAAEKFSFGIISPPATAVANETISHDIIEAINAVDLTFVVANGIKAANEPCTDEVYSRQKSLLNNIKHELIISLTAADWATCQADNGKSAAFGKLSRLRDLFFADKAAAKEHSFSIIRQSTAIKFRSFVENARWEIDRIMFATINLPANNNHYIFDAGRNSEFEDRQIANRNWVNRIFTHAIQNKLQGIVLITDGNPLSRHSRNTRDGFLETRRHILTMAAHFRGKVLIIHRQPTRAASSSIHWRDNIGEIASPAGWTTFTVNRSKEELFSITKMPPLESNH